MTHPPIPALLGLASALVLAPPTPAGPQDADPGTFEAMAARSIGPAGMSGRVTAIQAVPSDPETIFAGTASGGLFRSTDDGLTWDALFDDQPVASIGSIAIDPRSPEVIWVGTGEGNPRNSSCVGDGVFRSRDGGKTWEHVGLRGTEKIHRLLVDPTDPDVAYAGALGTSWGENPERGIFRTRDGGETWERVLYVDERTGCADLVMDPSNPRKLVAAMWEHRRWPWFFTSGGPGSGLWVSTDGGDTWVERTSDDGLPAGDLGRMGLGFSRSNPQVLYAIVEAETNVFLRSTDGGSTFETRNSDNATANRPFYYADIRVDPWDSDRIYNLASTVTVSNDAGATWSTLIPWSLIHPDHHSMWVNPLDPHHIIEGNDGGLSISRNHGASWRFVRNLPLAQYYHINVDMDVPYHVYGGMQDNGSWRGPSSVWENGGIRNHHWDEIGFGDGFAALPLPEDSQVGYGMSQGGALFRWNNRTGERKSIRPPAPDGVDLRFNWNAGIALDPFDPNGVFYGSQFVHRSRDRGETWEIASPDLTTNNPEWQKQAESGGLTPDVTAAENYVSILTIAPSTLDQNVIWVGTDDGRLHVTRDGGTTWTSLEGNLFGAPKNTWIPHVEPSKFDPAEAFVVLDDHRRSNWETYVFRTTDFGASWTDLAGDGISGYAHAIEQDPVDPSLLFVGTEFGLFVSQDGGASWFKWTHGVPTVAVRALVVHPRDHDLVIGTFGRAAYVIDDIRPLRNPGEEDADARLRLVDIPSTYLYRVKQTGEARFPGSEEFRGENRPRAALISFFASAGDDEEELPDEATVEILGADGASIRKFEESVSAGFNRIAWDLRHTGFRSSGDDSPSGDLPGGPEALPGTYTVRVTWGEHSAEGPLELLADPRVEVSQADRQANFAMLVEVGRLGETLGAALQRIEHTTADVDAILELAERDVDPDAADDAPHPHEAVVELAKTFRSKLDAVDERLRGPQDTKGIVRSQDSVASYLGRVRGTVGSSWDAPTAAAEKLLAEARTALEEAVAEVNQVLSTDLDAFRDAVEASGVTLLDTFEPLRIR